MIAFLRDPIWQSIGAFAAVSFSIFLYYMQKNKKSLSCRVLAETSLLTINEDVKGKFQITYEGVSVQNVYLIIIKVLNDGNVPISSSDFEKDHELTFSFGESAHVLNAEIILASPESLRPTLRITQSSVAVQPLLLNSKDEFDIKILCDRYHEGVHAEARIVGVRAVKFFKLSSQNDDSLTLKEKLRSYMLGSIIASAFLATWLFFTQVLHIQQIPSLIFSVLVWGFITWILVKTKIIDAQK